MAFLFANVFVVGLVGIGLFLMSSLKVINEYERAVIFRLGRLIGTKGPGLIMVVPILDRYSVADLRTFTLDVPAQDIITRDNVTLKVNAVVYVRVIDPKKMMVQVADMYLATSQLAQTSLRSVVGQVDLDTALTGRDEINHKLQAILDHQTESWGIKISSVEVKQVDLPVEMQRAMARQAEAERERRAKVISAEGELQSSKKLSEAAHVLSSEPGSMQLRYLQTMLEMSSERTSTIFFPFPVELLHGMESLATAFGRGGSGAASRGPGKTAQLKLESGKVIANCPECSARFNVTQVLGDPKFDLDPQTPGQQVKCNACKAIFTLPQEVPQGDVHEMS